MHYYNKPHVNFVITEDVTSWDNKKETLRNTIEFLRRQDPAIYRLICSFFGVAKAIVSVLIEAEKSLANKYLGLNYSHRALVQDEQGPSFFLSSLFPISLELRTQLFRFQGVERQFYMVCHRMMPRSLRNASRTFSRRTWRRRTLR